MYYYNTKEEEEKERASAVHYIYRGADERSIQRALLAATAPSRVSLPYSRRVDVHVRADVSTIARFLVGKGSECCSVDPYRRGRSCLYIDF